MIQKNPRRTNYSSIFSSKIQNLTVFSMIYMIRIRFFGPARMNSEPMSGRTVLKKNDSFSPDQTSSAELASWPSETWDRLSTVATHPNTAQRPPSLHWVRLLPFFRLIVPVGRSSTGVAFGILWNGYVVRVNVATLKSVAFDFTNNNTSCSPS